MSGPGSFQGELYFFGFVFLYIFTSKVMMTAITALIEPVIASDIKRGPISTSTMTAAPLRQKTYMFPFLMKPYVYKQATNTAADAMYHCPCFEIVLESESRMHERILNGKNQHDRRMAEKKIRRKGRQAFP